MSEMNITQTAESIVNDLADEDIDADVDTVANDLDEAVNKYGLPEDQAISTVISNRTPTDMGANGVLTSSDDRVMIEELGELHEDANDGAWVTVAGEITGTWEIDHSSVAQKAELGDETGRAEVTVWASADAPELEEGDVVELQNVPTDKFQGNYQVNISPNSSVEALDEDIDPVDNMNEVAGRVVAARDGLIKRCPEEDCSRTLNSDRCSEHGEVEGEHDLRLKLSIDNGMTVNNVTLHREEVEDLFDTTLEEQKQIAMDALSEDKPGEKMGKELMGHKLVAEGPELYDSIHADEFALITGDIDQDAVEESLVAAREARPDAVGN